MWPVLLKVVVRIFSLINYDHLWEVPINIIVSKLFLSSRKQPYKGLCKYMYFLHAHNRFYNNYFNLKLVHVVTLPVNPRISSMYQRQLYFLNIFNWWEYHKWTFTCPRLLILKVRMGEWPFMCSCPRLYAKSSHNRPGDIVSIPGCSYFRILEMAARTALTVLLITNITDFFYCYDKYIYLEANVLNRLLLIL